MTRNVPAVFVSYCWESDVHKQWVREFATRLRSDGVDVRLDIWEIAPGDQLPAFMDRAVRENDFILVICTPSYKRKSDSRQGGVGYEGDIMTAEIFTAENHRKFIPILREAVWKDAAPSWMMGKSYIDLSGSPYNDVHYVKLLQTLHGNLEQAPPLGDLSRTIGHGTPKTCLGNSKILLGYLASRPHIHWIWEGWNDTSPHIVALVIAATVMANSNLDYLQKPSRAKFMLSDPGGLTPFEVNISFTDHHLIFEVEGVYRGCEGFWMEKPSMEHIEALWWSEFNYVLGFERIMATSGGELNRRTQPSYKQYVEMHVPFMR